MAGIDINRTTTNVINDPEISSEIWGKAIEESFFMQHARRITIPGPGIKVQTITGEPTANWVAETNAKPVSTHTFGTKTITPYKLAVIEPFSMEFMRDKPALYDELVRRLPGALATKFDATILSTTAPGSGFDVLGSATKVSLIPGNNATVYDQFLAADAAIAAGGGSMNAIGLAPQGRAKVLAAVDGDKRPLFTAGTQTGSIDNILGATVDINKRLYVAGAAGSPGTPAIVGVAGDFEDAVYGMVSDISIEFSREATLTNGNATYSLWQNNMVACKVECEIAFAVKSASEFVLLTGDTPSA